ncbi:MAG: LuxR family transcriptional regulator [Alphaproteobacteria bacterium]|nr:MAG: LuxR family transcriptional regulator [Alphaproteobacteria bacterium]
MLRDRYIISFALFVQVVCAAFFLSDIFSSYIGFRTTPISWEFREIIEIGAAVGLVLGVVLGAVALARSDRRRKAAEARLRAASAAFMDMVEESFSQWGLTPAERDVALFAIKGLSTQDIAALRNTSEGTVKAQTNAIYRKAGVSGRSQLLSLFIENLMDDDLFDAARAGASGAKAGAGEEGAASVSGGGEGRASRP